MPVKVELTNVQKEKLVKGAVDRASHLFSSRTGDWNPVLYLDQSTQSG